MSTDGRPQTGPGSGGLGTAAAVMGWIGAVLLVDAAPLPDPVEPLRQLLLGLLTWAALALALRREPPTVRAQTLLVVALATVVEYTFSPLLGAYTYRIGTVPLFVPPGHGLVYLGALSIGRIALVRRHARLLVGATVVVGGRGRWGRPAGRPAGRAGRVLVPLPGRVPGVGAGPGCCTSARSWWSATSSWSAPALGTWAWATRGPDRA